VVQFEINGCSDVATKKEGKPPECCSLLACKKGFFHGKLQAAESTAQDGQRQEPGGDYQEAAKHAEQGRELVNCGDAPPVVEQNIHSSFSLIFSFSPSI
jgi:hypothetical protein